VRKGVPWYLAPARRRAVVRANFVASHTLSSTRPDRVRRIPTVRSCGIACSLPHLIPVTRTLLQTLSQSILTSNEMMPLLQAREFTCCSCVPPLDSSEDVQRVSKREDARTGACRPSIRSARPRSPPPPVATSTPT
jgi:hypothetical protein